VVIIIIGILSSLAYSSFVDIIFTNRAKETAQTMRTFVERALAEGKRQSDIVELKIISGNIQYTIGERAPVAQPLSPNYSASPAVPNCEPGSLESFNDGAKSKNLLGITSIVQTIDTTKSEGYFAACDSKGYCGAAVKVKEKNSFIACIKKGNKAASWEAL
jgi:type II secretory pathway pseudopilin PulG